MNEIRLQMILAQRPDDPLIQVLGAAIRALRADVLRLEDLLYDLDRPSNDTGGAKLERRAGP